MMYVKKNGTFIVAEIKFSYKCISFNVTGIRFFLNTYLIGRLFKISVELRKV